jgi:small multidrug resistance family-3 protein
MQGTSYRGRTPAEQKDVSNLAALLILIIAALLEAGGDAVVRTGLHSQNMAQRVGLIVLGGLVLTAYGIVVNTPAWDFGRLLGVYVALFFLAAQAINLVVFHVLPGPPVLLGGTLIIAGGLLMTFWR